MEDAGGNSAGAVLLYWFRRHRLGGVFMPRFFNGPEARGIPDGTMRETWAWIVCLSRLCAGAGRLGVWWGRMYPEKPPS